MSTSRPSLAVDPPAKSRLSRNETTLSIGALVRLVCLTFLLYFYASVSFSNYKYGFCFLGILVIAGEGLTNKGKQLQSIDLWCIMLNE